MTVYEIALSPCTWTVETREPTAWKAATGKPEGNWIDCEVGKSPVDDYLDWAVAENLVHQWERVEATVYDLPLGHDWAIIREVDADEAARVFAIAVEEDGD